MKMDATFYDGILYIICLEHQPYMDKEGVHNGRYSVEVMFQDPEYDKPISLKQIKEKYPRVKKVLHEEAQEGHLYTYGNHGEFWEETGKTKGYA